MRISTFFYTLKQGIKNIFRNGWYSLASVATISACLLLFGTFFSIVINVVHIVKTAEEGVAVTVFFDEGLEDEKIAQIGELISKRSEVREMNYVSADEAWETFRQDLGEYGEGFAENPLEDSSNYEIYLNEIENQNSLVEYIESIEGVRMVNRSDLTANILTGMNSLMGYIAVAIIAILLAVSVFLISNTVMIGISMRKEEITIMKYIGATDFFVRAPFVVEGLVKAYRELLKTLDLGLEDRLSTKVGLLSGGQRQAVTLLMATMNKPKLLLLDEHTAALDPKTASKVLEITERIVRENHLTTLMITHNMKDAITYGNRLIMLHEGHVVVDVSGEEKKMLTVEDLLALFVKASGNLFADDRTLLS